MLDLCIYDGQLRDQFQAAAKIFILFYRTTIQSHKRLPCFALKQWDSRCAMKNIDLCMFPNHSHKNTELEVFLFPIFKMPHVLSTTQTTITFLKPRRKKVDIFLVEANLSATQQGSTKLGQVSVHAAQTNVFEANKTKSCETQEGHKHHTLLGNPQPLALSQTLVTFATLRLRVTYTSKMC